MAETSRIAEPIRRTKGQPSTTRAAVRGMTEEQLQANVIEMCRLLRLYVYHTHNSRHSEAGFPDLVIAGRGGLLFPEIKTETGKLSPAQVDVLGRLSLAGAVAVVWRPSHLIDGTITRALRALTHRPTRPLPPTGHPGEPEREPCGCLVSNVEEFGHVCSAPNVAPRLVTP